jgi:hypothetical protein
MMKKLLISLLALGALLIGATFVVHYGGASFAIDSGRIMKSPYTKIQLGDPHWSDLSGPGASLDDHPSGAKFYQREWMEGSLGVVELVHGKHSFVIDNVLSILGSADKDVPSGIYDWKVNFGVSPAQTDTQEAALERVMKLFADLRAAGWKRYIDVDYPRLSGRQALEYRNIKSIYPLDPSYKPSAVEWKVVAEDMPKWKFYADGVYLNVSLVESSVAAVGDKKTYLLSVEMMDEYAFYGLGFFPGNAENIRNWRALLPGELRRYHADRLETETLLKAQGYSIDTNYQDPPIIALQKSSENR